MTQQDLIRAKELQGKIDLLRGFIVPCARTMSIRRRSKPLILRMTRCFGDPTIEIADEVIVERINKILIERLAEYEGEFAELGK